MASPKPTVFFSPGGFHTPWVFDSVRSILSDRGFATEVSELLSVGTTDPSIGMLSDAKHLRSLLTKIIDEGKEIVFVAHSYGGIVVSNAVEGLSVEQRAAEGKQGGIVITWLRFLSPPDKDGFLVVKQPIHRFYADVESSLANKAVEALKPMSSQAMIEKSTYEPWNEGFEVGYVFTEEDNTLAIDMQKAIFSQFPNGSFSASLPSGHSPFLNIPDAVADAIQNAVSYLFTKRSCS